MQLDVKGTPTTISGAVGKLTALKISASKHTFGFLSTGIYNDKIRAVLREMGCNAADAHVAAGTPDEPFEIHLPTQYDPVFRIKDNGIGLKFIKGGCEKCEGSGTYGNNECDLCEGTGDYDGCKRLYCTYFESDKTSRNDQIGGFGLGSKSPYAYTNKRLPDGSFQSGGFTVTNRYNGVKYEYAAMVNEGIPACVMMAFDDTDEPNGVEVQFAVDPNDIWEFENKAAIVFEFFNPVPRFNKPITLKVADYSVKTALWGMRSDSAGLRAIMGNVQYSVGNIDPSRLTEAQKKMVSMPIDLFFNIGELEPALSREVLQLDDNTINNILARLDVVQAKLMDEVKKELDKCPTGWEARLKLHTLSMQSGMGGLINDAFNKGMFFGKYTGFKLESTKVTINELDYNNVALVECHATTRGRKKLFKQPLFEYTEANKRAGAFRDIQSKVTKKSDYDVKFDVSTDLLFILNDLKTGSDKYVTYLLKDDDSTDYRTYSKAIVINRPHGYVAIDRAMAEGVELIEAIGNPPVVKMSDLKALYDPLMKEHKEQRFRAEKKHVRILRRYVKSYRKGTGWRKQWDNGNNIPELNDPSVIKFYILVDSFGEPVNSQQGMYYSRDAIKFFESCRDSGLFPELLDVYGLKADSKYLQDVSFFAVFPYILDKIKSMLTPEKEMEMSLVVKPFSSNWEFLLQYIEQHPQVLALESPIRQFAQVIVKAQKAAKVEWPNHKKLVDIARSLRLPIDNTTNFNTAWEQVVKLYPMLKICCREGYADATIDEKTAIVDYLRWVDDQRKRLILSNVSVVIETEEELVNA
jgi:hypothetical protein